jgi:hypothetical protein
VLSNGTMTRKKRAIMTDQYLADLATQLARQTEGEPAGPNLSDDRSTDHFGDPPFPPQESIRQPPPPLLTTATYTPSTSIQVKKTPDELAAMILADLSEIEGCPKRGVKVIVYGYNPWNAWLSFGTDAGAVRNKADLQGFFNIVTERLKRLYDVAM